MTWAEQELGDTSLGDARLSRRLVKLATRLAESPAASIPQACRGWAEMRAAYRFLAQDKLDWQDMLQPHWYASAQRMREHLSLDNQAEAFAIRRQSSDSPQPAT